MDIQITWLDPLFEALEQFAETVLAFLPTLLSAAAVLGGGVVLGLMFKVIVLRVAKGVSLIIARATGGQRARHVRLPWPLSVILANLLFWLTVVFFLAVAMRILGLAGIADWIAGAARYLPRALLAAAILLIGYAFAIGARDATVRSGQRLQVLSSGVYFLVLTVAVLAALRQLGIDLVVVRSLILIAAGAAFGGLAFAFGMGASSALDNIIASYYVRRVYRPGNRVRIGGSEGEILEISPTAVVLDTATGRAMVPAKKFNQEVSVLFGKEGGDRGQ